MQMHLLQQTKRLGNAFGGNGGKLILLEHDGLIKLKDVEGTAPDTPPAQAVMAAPW